MRIAVLADVHGNVRALEAVLADLAHWGPDTIVNLGDCASGPLEAAATMDLLMQQDMQTVRGNHDREIVKDPPDLADPSDVFARAQLNENHLQWLRALPATVTLDGGSAGSVLACHGTPSDDLSYLVEDVWPYGTGLASAVVVSHRLTNTAARVVLCGHTHLARLVRTASGRIVVNPGSVGLQAFEAPSPYPHVIESGSPHARYALIDTEPGISVLFRAVAYDWDAAAAAARDAGRPEWAIALETGFARPFSAHLTTA